MSLSALGKYEIRGVLGRGAAGVVYDAWDPIIARRVAIKTVRLPTGDDPDSAEDLERFRREAQAAGRLSHPNIVAVFDYGETDEIAYIVMEYVDGGSLQVLIKDVKRVALPEVLTVMEQVLAGLQYSHDRGIVHRDIKPANVMLTADNTVKITDFGIARIEGSSATVVGTMLGTPAYMSPEQWRGDATIDARSDIYAAGAMLYHMLTGRRPFEDSSQSVIMGKVLNGTFDLPSVVLPSLPRGLDTVVRSAMARSPAHRYASAAAFAGALRQAIAGAAEPDATLVVPYGHGTARAIHALGSYQPEPGGLSRTSLAIGVLAVLVVSGWGAALWYLTRSAGPQQPVAEIIASPVTPAEPPGAESHPEPPPALPGLRQLLAAEPCEAVYGDASPARLSLRGVIAQERYAALRASFERTEAQSRNWAVRPIPDLPAYCQIIDILRPALRGLGESAGVTARLLPSPATHELQLVGNDPIDFDITGPDYPSVLQVDYIDSTGKVSHYMPRSAAPAFGARRLTAGEHVRLFDTIPGAAFQVGPPPGTDLAVVIASSEQLRIKYAKDDDEDVAVYLAALRAGLDAALRRGVRLSVELVPVVSTE